MSDKPRDDLHYFKWEVMDAKALQQMIDAEAMTLAQVGELFFAVMAYVDKVEVEVSPDLKMLFATYKVRIDNNREARVKVGLSKAENGRKGGTAKAENAKKRAAAYKPPTKKEFQDAVKHYLDAGDIEEASSYDVGVLFDQLKDAGWSIGREPIQRRSDWESAILARFGTAPEPFTSKQYYMVFETIFSTLHAMRDDEGHNGVDSITYDFFETYDESSRTWIVDGMEFKNIKSALAQFMTQYTENIPP